MGKSVSGGREFSDSSSVLGVPFSPSTLLFGVKSEFWFVSLLVGCSKKVLGIWMSGSCPATMSWPLILSRKLGEGNEDREDICGGLRRPICSRSGMVLMLLELGLIAIDAADWIRFWRHWSFAAWTASTCSLAAWSSHGRCSTSWRRLASAMS